MKKVLLFSDPHITDGAPLVGLDPAARLRAALDHALARHGDADHLVFLGDLVHDGSPAEYAAFAAILAERPLPWTATLGNHDDRAAFFAAFPSAARDPSGFAQSVLDLGGHRLILLDTLDDTGGAPRHSGVLCAARLDWLRARLDEDDRPTAVACHHPAFATGFDGMDAIGLRNADALLGILARNAHVRLLICGHIHRAISGSVGGLAFGVLKSPCHQMPLHLGPASSGLSEASPGGYGLLLCTTSGFVLHGDDVTDIAPRHDPGSAA